MTTMVNFTGVTSTQWEQTERHEVAPGIWERVVWSEGDDKRVCVYEFSPGAAFPGVDVHAKGPEQIYVIRGIFNDGHRDHPAGSFIHNPTGSAHIPQSAEGCAVLISWPQE